MKNRENYMYTLVMVIAALSMGMIIVHADKGGDASTVLAPINNLKVLMTSAVGAIGYFQIVKNALELGSAWQQHDSSTMTQAIKGLVGGVFIAGIGTVLTIMGIS